MGTPRLEEMISVAQVHTAVKWKNLFGTTVCLAHRAVLELPVLPQSQPQTPKPATTPDLSLGNQIDGPSWQSAIGALQSGCICASLSNKEHLYMSVWLCHVLTAA